MSKRLLPFALVALFGPEAGAAPACGQRTDVVAQFAKRYQEAPVGVGLASHGGLLELLSAKTGSTSTLIITMPNGQSCLWAADGDWQPRAIPINGPEA